MKHILATTLPVVLGLSLLGCNKTTPEVSPAEAQSESETEAVASNLPADAPTIIISADANYPPYGLKDDHGNVTGFDVELIQAIGKQEGFNVEILADPWEETFNNLENGSRDLIIGGTVYSDERNDKYLLSHPYAPLPNTIAYLDNDVTINNLEDLRGLNLGVLNNSSPYRFFSENNYGLANIKQYPTVFLAVQAMVQGKVNAIAGDSGVIRYTLNNSGLDLNHVKYFDYGELDEAGARKVMLTKKEDSDLLNKINDGLDKVIADGTYSKLTKKWFGKDLTDDLNKQQKMLNSAQ